MWVHRRGIAVAGVVLVTALGCGWSESTTGNRANREACEAYVAHMNELTPCMGVTYDVDNMCAGADQTPVDMASYYDCLRTNSSCNGLEPSLSLDVCQQPTLDRGEPVTAPG